MYRTKKKCLKITCSTINYIELVLKAVLYELVIYIKLEYLWFGGKVAVVFKGLGCTISQIHRICTLAPLYKMRIPVAWVGKWLWPLWVEQRGLDAQYLRYTVSVYERGPQHPWLSPSQIMFQESR
jgi:hypothetical protein